MTGAAFGEISGVSVGTVFKDRRALYDSGVHRQLQAGIAGGEQTGADSIVVSRGGGGGTRMTRTTVI